ncbi:hypothetical protein [Mesorhizobium sp. M8A.F.Ca.ET.208.01.1.1]
MNPRMLVEFVDGSKTMVEMCAIANATGLVRWRLKPTPHRKSLLRSRREK